MGKGIETVSGDQKGERIFQVHCTALMKESVIEGALPEHGSSSSWEQ
jgi:hypothetical protein